MVAVGATELHEVLGQLAQARGQHKDNQQPGSCVLQADYVSSLLPGPHLQNPWGEGSFPEPHQFLSCDLF